MPVHVTHEFSPIWDERSKILLLGTMPSPRSREAGFYYAHPQNRFWPTLSRVLGEEVPVSSDSRRALALRHGVAIWDVLQSCDIENASDASIRRPSPNPLGEVVRRSRVAAVFTTGVKAFQLYKRLGCESLTGLPAILLPSTSPANRRVSDNELFSAYSQIRDFLAE